MLDEVPVPVEVKAAEKAAARIRTTFEYQHCRACCCGVSPFVSATFASVPFAPAKQQLPVTSAHVKNRRPHRKMKCPDPQKCRNE
ncbi:hypothetical protein [Burkholderia sp. Ac-20353]|uniref:hypothetical protein n=1 Tax=Burkholderia sp. Ac-20353 TaxID=2703894 RepID=UPI00197BCD58|nr:hypothetical protein [Burkholderia sp. Ac-20353]